MDHGCVGGRHRFPGLQISSSRRPPFVLPCHNLVSTPHHCSPFPPLRSLFFLRRSPLHLQDRRLDHQPSRSYRAILELSVTTSLARLLISQYYPPLQNTHPGAVRGLAFVQSALLFYGITRCSIGAVVYRAFLGTENADLLV